MDAFELLKKDHKKVSTLFSEIESSSAQAKMQVFRRLKAELDLHAHIEETVLYPALENTEEAREITLEAYEEHKVVKDLLGELANAGAPDDEWDAKLTVLKENVEHHVEEEEGELFSKARKALGQDRIEQLGAELEAEKTRKTGGNVKTLAAKPSGTAATAKNKSAKNESPGVLQRIANLVGLGDSRSSGSDKSVKKPASRSGKASLKTRSTPKAGKNTSTRVGAAKSARKAAAKKSSSRSSSKATKSSSKKKASKVSRTTATKSVPRAASNQKVKARGARKSGRASKSPTKARRKSR